MPAVRTQEIAAEQQVVDRIHQRLDVLREQARALEGEGHQRATTRSATGLVERDAIVHRAATRMHELDSEADGLVFGRLDFTDGDTYHIGRLGVRDGIEPLLVDWRAPAAAPFYRATTGDPLGVVRRRVIFCRGERVVDLDDDLLSPEATAAGDLRVLGEGALLAALRRSRGPHMRDIVTTIQREQDEAIRAPARGVTLITGGPGTGKTQVALHRAAYLLYTDRGRFTGGRILVVGPSTVFTDYIGRVLPSLGEDSVHLRAIGELFDGVTATRRDRAEVARIKGSEHMREVLTELMWQTPPGAPDKLRIVYAGQVLTIGAGDLSAARTRVRARCEADGTLPNSARRAAAAVLLDELWSTVDADHLDRELFLYEVGDRSEFQRFLRAWWPPLTPTAVLAWLADPSRVAGPDAETLSASYGDGFSVDDVPLLDELTGLLGDPPPPPRAPKPEWQLRELTTERRLGETFVLSCGLQEGWELYAPGLATPMALAGPGIDNDAAGLAQRWAEAVILREGHQVVGWTDGFDPHGEEGYVPVLAEPLPVAETDDTPVEEPYLHVIVDEAQDLSPMECRMIARRAAYASMTIVGDLGQATHPLAADSWADLVSRLGKHEVRALDLHTGYRVPQTIADYAARALAPGIEPTRSYQPGGKLEVRQVDDLAAAAREEITRMPAEATVAVIAADNLAQTLGAIPGATVVPASMVKGLEYDHVIVLEPGEIVAAEPRGLARLYVTLTRAVAGLVVLHREPLPAELVLGVGAGVVAGDAGAVAADVGGAPLAAGGLGQEQHRAGGVGASA
ncbi:Part of AAA domain-containing protein [Asanoa hainanensis]|uniref:Part of AAA domain-containing protein n=1 Tax=Asanoa hainanensis TaxID=560556 RepID=A0A239PHX3_9ACTN|nr:UvrD-helicase domain-containing protein [Asanoa hainanensis]SNT65909.1 Part of AAA domain-containing protein [Asanoa hainanensis]